MADSNAYDELLETALRVSQHYLAGGQDAPVYPSAADCDALAAFNCPLPANPNDPVATLTLLDRVGSPATVRTSGGRYFGFVTGGALPVAVAADWLLSAWDQAAPLEILSPAVAAIEAAAARYILDALNLPRNAAVAFPTGASHGNLVALAAARHAVLLKQGWDVEQEGLSGAPLIRLIISDEAHATLIKAIGILGLGKRNVEIVPSDAQGRIRVDLMPPLDATCIVCAQLGNVNSGACDDVNTIADLTQAAGAWLHIDGAFGLWARTVPSLAALVAGAERADTWVTDGHKWLNTPYDCGIIICRHLGALTAAMGFATSYMPQGTIIPPKDMLIEFSRRARGVTVWAAMHSLGRSGLIDLIEGCCAHARTVAARLCEMGFTIHNDVVLNQVVASFGDGAQTDYIRDAVTKSGVAWFGPTRWKGHHAFRISVSSWATTASDIEMTLAAVKKAVEEMANQPR